MILNDTQCNESIVVANEQLIITNINKKTLEIFGYNEEELLNKNVKILMTEKTSLKHDRYINNYYSGKKPEIIGTQGKKVLGKTKNGDILNLFLSIGESYHNNNKKIFTATFAII